MKLCQNLLEVQFFHTNRRGLEGPTWWHSILLFKNKKNKNKNLGHNTLFFFFFNLIPELWEMSQIAAQIIKNFKFTFVKIK